MRPALALAIFALWALAQQPGPEDMPQEMIWVDRSGHIGGRVGSVQQSIFFPELSPDQKSIAVSARDGEVNDRDVWIHDVASGNKRRIVTSKGNDNFPLWSPDGDAIAFNSSRTGQYCLYVKKLRSETAEERIFCGKGPVFPRDWSPDGKRLLFTDGAGDVRAMSLLGMSSPYDAQPFLSKSGAWQDGGRFSPNGKYVAYASNAGGPWEVYVAAVDDPGKPWKVSRELASGWAGGGGQPRWRRDGKELFYMMGNDTMLSVEVNTEGAFTFSKPKRLFALPAMRGNFPEEAPWLAKYDVTRDGQRFVFVRTVVK